MSETVSANVTAAEATAAEVTETKESKNFIEQIIEKDLAEGVYDTVHNAEDSAK